LIDLKNSKNWSTFIKVMNKYRAACFLCIFWN